MCRGSSGAGGRDRSVGRKPCRSVVGRFQRVVLATSNARCSDSSGVCSACGRAAMASGCVGASRMMESRRDGGGRSGGGGGGDDGADG